MPYPNYQSFQQNYQQNPQSFQQSYQQPQNYQQSFVQGQSPLMNPSSGITWVQGEIGARAYPVGAGNSVLLMDSDDKYFYIKSADMSGMPKLHKYYYSEVVGELPMLTKSSGDGEHEHEDINKTIDHLQNEVKEIKELLQAQSKDNHSNENRGGRKNG